MRLSHFLGLGGVNKDSDKGHSSNDETLTPHPLLVTLDVVLLVDSPAVPTIRESWWLSAAAPPSCHRMVEVGFL